MGCLESPHVDSLDIQYILSAAIKSGSLNTFQLLYNHLKISTNQVLLHATINTTILFHQVSILNFIVSTEISIPTDLIDLAVDFDNSDIIDIIIDSLEDERDLSSTLCRAVDAQNEDLLSFLVTNGYAHPSCRDHYPLSSAIELGSTSLVSLLISLGASVLPSHLCAACTRNDKTDDLVHLLLSKSDVDPVQALFVAVEMGKAGVVTLIMATRRVRSETDLDSCLRIAVVYYTLLNSMKIDFTVL
jgi:hypothetical protein